MIAVVYIVGSDRDKMIVNIFIIGVYLVLGDLIKGPLRIVDGGFLSLISDILDVSHL